MALASPVVMIGMILWHELGRTVAALLVGDETARFVLTDPSNGCFGCFYDSAAVARCRTPSSTPPGFSRPRCWPVASCCYS